MTKYIKHIKPLLPWLFLIALLTWGTYVTLYYLGTDGHIVVLLKSADWNKIGQEFGDPFMRGLNSIGPFFDQLFERLKPFIGYAVVSAVLYLAFVVFTVLRTGRIYIKTRLSAFGILLLAIGSLWLLHTSLFYAEFPGTDPRLIIEPNEQVYEGASEETISVLKENFENLKDSGCLIQDKDRKGRGGAGVYFYRGWCVQKSFFVRVLPPLGMLLLFVLNMLVLGSAVLKLARARSSGFFEFVVSLAVGSAALMAALWFLALFHALNQGVVWALLILIPAVGYTFSRYWICGAFNAKWDVRESFHSVSVLLLWVLISYIAFNFLTVIRPFPIGWDDLGRYINLPRQLSVMNQILPGIPAIQWEYITSLGFILFGYFSDFGATLAQQINWLAGLFAVLAVYGCTRMLLGERTGLLAALFYYMLPMVGHFSFADMKTENALFFFGVVGLMCILKYLECIRCDESTDNESESGNKSSLWWLLFAGILFAASFATKATMILMFFVSGIFFTAALLGVASGWGAALISLAILSFAGPLSFTGITTKIYGLAIPWLDDSISASLLIVGVLLLVMPRIKDASKLLHLKKWLCACGVLLAGFIIFSIPWMGRNMILNGRVSISSSVKAPNTITPWVKYSSSEITADAPAGSRALPEELQVDREHKMCEGTARTEELDRYWGHGDGWEHYLGLPWRVVMNIDSQGYYLTTSPLVMLAVLVLLLPLFWKRENKMLRILFWATTLYVLEWIVIASGIPWYGIGIFLGLAIFVEALVALSPNSPSRVVVSCFIVFALMTSISLRLWQFGMQFNLYEYAWGKASGDVLREMTIPDYDDIADRVMELSKNPERPYLFRMGTFISYFIPRNREIFVVNDNQLQFFNCLNQEEDHKLTLKRLHALGFHSIVFDTNTATIEKNPNGTLHQKVQRFLDFANDEELGIVSVVNNPGAGVAYMILPENLPEEIVTDEDYVEESE